MCIVSMVSEQWFDPCFPKPDLKPYWPPIPSVPADPFVTPPQTLPIKTKPTGEEALETALREMLALYKDIVRRLDAIDERVGAKDCGMEAKEATLADLEKRMDKRFKKLEKHVKGTSGGGRAA